MENTEKVIDELQSLLDSYNITVEELVEMYKKQRKVISDTPTRKIQHYSDGDNGIWCYFIKGEKNPCGCGSNCYHYEYDAVAKKIYGVCNACNRDIYEVKEENVQELLGKGIWQA